MQIVLNSIRLLVLVFVLVFPFFCKQAFHHANAGSDPKPPVLLGLTIFFFLKNVPYLIILTVWDAETHNTSLVMTGTVHFQQTRYKQHKSFALLRLCTVKLRILT